MKRDPLVWGSGGGIAAALLLVPAVGGTLERLTAARRAQADAALPVPRPAALVRPDLAWPVGSDDAATRMAAELRGRARADGVLVERAEPLAAPEGLVTLDVRLSGSERAVLALANGLERGQPLARWRRWSVTPAAAGLRLDGELVAPWR